MDELGREATWERLTALFDQRAALDAQYPDVPVSRLNRLGELIGDAIGEITRDPRLLDLVRSRARDTRDPVELARLWEILHPPLLEHGTDVAGLLEDPLVALESPGQVQAALALYLSEFGSAIDPYESENFDPQDLQYRNLSRIGGVPTEVRTLPAAAADPLFLLQVDLHAITEHAAWDAGVRQVMDELALPTGGLLQFFHTTLGDSRTDPHLPGGGAAIRYLTEGDLEHRRPIVPAPLNPRPSRVQWSALPTFRFGSDPGADATIERIIALQQDAHVLARSGSWSAEYEQAIIRNPFDAREAPSSHLGGLAHYDSDLADEDRDILNSELPLRSTDDRHVLLMELSAGTTFDDCFGDDGRLELWLRASDIQNRAFEPLVSFMRSS